MSSCRHHNHRSHITSVRRDHCDYAKLCPKAPITLTRSRASQPALRCKHQEHQISLSSVLHSNPGEENRYAFLLGMTEGPVVEHTNIARKRHSQTYLQPTYKQAPTKNPNPAHISITSAFPHPRNETLTCLHRKVNMGISFPQRVCQSAPTQPPAPSHTPSP